MYRIALVSREVYPFQPSAGLGAYVTATATALAEDAEVTIITTDMHEEAYHELRQTGSPLLPPETVRFAFARDPATDESEGFYDSRHLWSACALAKLKEVYPDGGPHLVEFPDYLGEGAVTVQARNTLDPTLRHSRVCIRLYTTKEMTDVLNGHLPRDRVSRVACDLERYALANADQILWPGGGVLETYKHFYDGLLAPAELVGHAVMTTPPNPQPPPPSEELRLLYVGRLERRKGVHNLLRAVTGLEHQNWSLTLVGGDTPTAPLGGSMRGYLALAAADDPRIVFQKPVAREAIFDLLREHDVVVSPSLWECWPNVVLEAISQSRPVLATPVGGHVELVRPGRAGWLTDDSGEEALATALERILDDRAELQSLIESSAPRFHFEKVTDTEPIRAAYSELAAHAEEPPRQRHRAGALPLVSVIVPYFELDLYIEEAVESIFAQTYRPLEVIVVNDGSFREEDRILAELASRLPLTVLNQRNSGLGRARNFAIRQSQGKYVLPLDADDVIEPTFVERCVEILESRPTIAYVNSWSRYVDEAGEPWPGGVRGYRPFTNQAESLGALNVAGPASAVIRRRVFDLGHWYSVDATSYEDWLLYRDLADHGLFGHTIPEELLLYRVRGQSMFRAVAEPNHERLLAELETHRRELEVQWTP